MGKEEALQEFSKINYFNQLFGGKGLNFIMSDIPLSFDEYKEAYYKHVNKQELSLDDYNKYEELSDILNNNLDLLEKITDKLGMNLSIYKEKLAGNQVEKSIGIVSFN